MPKGPALSESERAEIRTLHDARLSARGIAKRLARSKTVVLNYLRDPALYGTVKRSGRRRALTAEQEQQLHAALVRHECAPAGVAQKSAAQLRRELNLPLSTRRIQQLLCAWRRDARRRVDHLHALTESGEMPATQPQPEPLPHGSLDTDPCGEDQRIPTHGIASAQV